MAKNRSSFGAAASKGLKESYENHFSSDISVSKMENAATPISTTETFNNFQGINPYYEYHPRSGQKGGILGRPRQSVKRTQISIGCTEEEKELYKKAAIADNRKLPDLVNRAIREYIENRGLNELF